MIALSNSIPNPAYIAADPDGPSTWPKPTQKGLIVKLSIAAWLLQVKSLRTQSRVKGFWFSRLCRVLQEFSNSSQKASTHFLSGGVGALYGLMQGEGCRSSNTTKKTV